MCVHCVRLRPRTLAGEIRPQSSAANALKTDISTRHKNQTWREVFSVIHAHALTFFRVAAAAQEVSDLKLKIHSPLKRKHAQGRNNKIPCWARGERVREASKMCGKSAPNISRAVENGQV
jgi:hypothetical protein